MPEALIFHRSLQSYMVGMRELRGTDFDACLYPLGGGLVVSGMPMHISSQSPVRGPGLHTLHVHVQVKMALEALPE